MDDEMKDDVETQTDEIEKTEEAHDEKIFSNIDNINDEKIDLKDDINSEEEETLPPIEENKAKQLNIGNIFAVIFIGISIFILIILFASKSNKKKSEQTNELDRTGSKINIYFEAPKEQTSTAQNNTKNDENIVSNKNVDEIMSTLPQEYQLDLPQTKPSQGPVGVAPVGSHSSTSSTTSDRPDTRNSKSVRKIEGIKGLENNNNQNSSSSSYLDNLLQRTGINPNMTLDDYSKQQLEKADELRNSRSTQNTMGFNTVGSSTNGTMYEENKYNFYNNNSDNDYSGSYLSELSIWDGTIISAVLETAINTDNPGVVIGRVSENVYSSYDGKYLLIPSGTILFADYNSSVSYGQKRIQIAWNLMIRPDGFRVEIGNFNGVDLQGMSGNKGFVNNHPLQVLKALGLVTFFSIIDTEVNAQIEDSNNDYLKNAMSSTYKKAADLSDKIMDRAMDIKPTITIKEGTEIKLITNKPITLPPVEVNPVTRKYVRQQ